MKATICNSCCINTTRSSTPSGKIRLKFQDSVAVVSSATQLVQFI